MLLEGGFGVQGSFQEHVYTGLSLLPNFRSFSGGIFGFERFSVDRGDLEVSLRYDALSRDAFLYRLDWQRHKRRGTLTDDDCLYRDETEMARCSNRYQVGAFSMGGILHLLPEAVDLKLNISSASRFPNLDELYLNGTAPSFPVYGLGDPSLDIETTYGISSAVGIQTSWLEGEASLFTSFIDGFVYFAPEKSEDGSLHYDVTIQGAWPRYSYDGIPAVFLGADGYVSLFPKGVIGIQAELSTVQAFDWNSGAHLLGIPSDQGSLELIGRIPDRGAVQSLEIGMNIRHVTKQDRVDPESDFAEAPEAYTLFGARCDMKIERKGMNNPLRIGILASNLFNQSYREYNSLLRYFAHQPGRDVRFHIGLDW
jgi:iron complex outermembrane receptor protein